MKRLVLVLIRGYQRWLSGAFGAHCIYEPTCSEFAAVAVERHGVARGLWLALRRIARCHPFAAGGFDPVP